MKKRLVNLLAMTVAICLLIVVAFYTSRASATPEVDDRLIPVTIDGEHVRLAVRIYKPQGDGPFPTMIFHHGSTGRGKNPDIFPIAWLPGTLINYFVDRGWAVVLPSRRGRGGSEGLYDEGFGKNRSKGYSWKPKYSIPGADRALEDVDAITDVILEEPFVDGTRVVVGGQSRGGILSVAHSGQRPELYRGVINFVGGWWGGKRDNAKKINNTIFKYGVPFGKETLWLYAKDDPYYSTITTQGYFKKFEKAGGIGTYVSDFPRKIGHGLVNIPEHWGPVVDAYLERMGVAHEPAPSAIRFTPDPSRPPTEFVGTWEGRWAGYSSWSTALTIESVSQEGVAIGTYTYIDTSYDIEALVEDGVLHWKGKRKSDFEFFVGRDGVLIGTYRRAKSANKRRAFFRAVMTRAE